MKKIAFLGLFLCLPALSWGESYFENRIQAQKRQWELLQAESLLEHSFQTSSESWGGGSGDAAPDHRIEINIPARKLFLYRDNEVIKTYSVAVGTQRYRTPVGPRSLQIITWNPWWYPPPYSDWAKGTKPAPPGPHNPLGRVKMSLGGDIFLHGTNKEHTVGTAASHGCMRMKNRDAQELAWYLQKQFSKFKDETLREKYQKHPGTSFPVTLDQKIPVTIQYDRVAVCDDAVEIYPDVYSKGPHAWSEVLGDLEKIGLRLWDIDPLSLSFKPGPDTVRIPIGNLLAFSSTAD